jgi:alpha-L-rhamnosidase
MFSSTYGGEDFDATREAKGWDRPGFLEGWEAARIVDGPGGQLQASTIPAIVAEKVYSPVGRIELKAGVSLYDLGQNMSGWPEIEVEGTAGSSVKLICGELLNSDGTVTQTGSGPGNSFTYTLGGGAMERWHPRFSYYGFRYVQVESSPAKEDPLHALPRLMEIGGDFVHANLTVDGSFESSVTLLNQIHKLIDMAILSNSMSVLTDCPHREKLGWLEQTYLNGSTLFYNYGYGNLYHKIDVDMEDAQTPDGLVPSIAPEYVEFNTREGKPTAFRDSPEWGSAAILSSWTAYQFTGNPEPLEQAYPMMEKYLAYLRGTAKDNIIDYGLGDWYDIGPGNPGYSKLTSRATHRDRDLFRGSDNHGKDRCLARPAEGREALRFGGL